MSIESCVGLSDQAVACRHNEHGTVRTTCGSNHQLAWLLIGFQQPVSWHGILLEGAGFWNAAIIGTAWRAAILLSREIP